MFRFGSKRDLRSDQSKCTIKLLHDKEILENVDFEVCISLNYKSITLFGDDDNDHHYHHYNRNRM